ncbi:hypothetical protein N656DRAFT_738358 [Canariomyces notabilis]|uniref:Uncharacterized protein n=1 Tax=Canariomyces notabilis TaxID=2074819 RepID=A0AAN6TA06_9PEZI|nr:hypothetical protein N656DRAFT_738358 [Canariomyces arenarius]
MLAHEMVLLRAETKQLRAANEQLSKRRTRSQTMAPGSRSLPAQNPLSSAVSRPFLHPPALPPVRDTSDSRSSGSRLLQNDLIEISGDDDSNNDSLDDGRSDREFISRSAAGTGTK